MRGDFIMKKLSSFDFKKFPIDEHDNLTEIVKENIKKILSNSLELISMGEIVEKLDETWYELYFRSAMLDMLSNKEIEITLDRKVALL
jgi:hypothetical protein